MKQGDSKFRPFSQEVELWRSKGKPSINAGRKQEDMQRNPRKELMQNPEMFLDGSHGSLVRSLAEKELGW